MKYGNFGGQYVPEELKKILNANAFEKLLKN